MTGTTHRLTQPDRALAPRPTRWRLGGPLLIAVALSLGPATHAWAQAQTLGFVVTQWNTAMYETLFMDECPEGPAPGNYEIWESSVTPEKRRSYPERLITQLRHVNYRGPNGEDVCAEPTSVQDPPLRIVEGKYAFGLNLDGNQDGAATPSTCAHGNFTGLNGEVGIDNQMYRLLDSLPRVSTKKRFSRF